MEQRLVSSGSFSWNPDCPDYSKVNHGNIRKFGRTRKGIQRSHCKTCKKTFVEAGCGLVSAPEGEKGHP